MKKVKILIMILILVFGFAFQCEVFHIELFRFQSSNYMTSIISYETETERIHLLEDIYNIASEQNVHVFATKMERINQFGYNITIYADHVVCDILAKQLGIEEKTYNSLLSGNVTVNYCNFEDLNDFQNRYISSISYIGSDEEIYNVYETISNIYEISSPEIASLTESDMIYSIWSIIVLLMIVMTCIEVVYRKKEIVVRISLGEDVCSIIRKEILLEILTDFILFGVIKTIVFHFLSGEFMKHTIFLMYSIGIILCCLCYCTYAIYDIKKAFSNVNDSKGILNITYGIKIIVTMLSIFTITTNLNTLMNDMLVPEESKLVSDFEDFSFLWIRDLDDTAEDEEYDTRAERQNEIYQQIFKDYYASATPAICSNILEDDENHLSYIYVNEFALSTMDDFLSDITYDSNADIVLLIPDYADNEITHTDAISCVHDAFCNTPNIDIQITTYSQNKTFTYMNSNATFGMTTILNPVIILNLYDGITDIDNMSPIGNPSDIMYQLTNKQLNEIIQKYDLEKDGYELTSTGVLERYHYNRNIVKRILAFCSSLCSLTFILQLVLIIVITNTEYRVNAMELALKKVMGYSVWKRNRRLLINNIFINILIIIFLSILCPILGLANTTICIGVGSTILLLELVVILFNIYRIENKNIQKILKGGCL